MVGWPPPTRACHEHPHDRQGPEADLREDPLERESDDVAQQGVADTPADAADVGVVDVGDNLSYLRVGKVIVIHPEGTVTRDPDGWPMNGRTGAVRPVC